MAEACLDKVPARRVMAKLEKENSSLSKTMVEKLRSGEELSPMEQFIFDEMHKDVLRKMFNELKATLNIAERGTGGRTPLFSGGCSDSVLAFSDMMEDSIPANQAFKKAENTCPIILRHNPLARFYEDPVITWVAEDAENFMQPTFLIKINGVEVPDSVYIKLFERGGLEWLSRTKIDEVTSALQTLFDSEYETFFKTK